MREQPISPPLGAKPDVDLPRPDSVALQRLIAEVRQAELIGPLDTTLYNRTYHRHNR